MTTHELLFIVGIGRSGTTALRRVLTAHPAIALGMERYKRLWNSTDLDQLTPELFEKDRFFDFSDGLTNLTPAPGDHWRTRSVDLGRNTWYADLEAKWDQARYVGDKMTVVRIERLRRLHPDAKLVCLVRDIEQVAHSWERRAHDPEDQAWPRRADGRAAVPRWNEALRRIRRAAREDRTHVVVVEFARFFGDPAATSLRAVLDFLDLPWEPEVAAAFAEAHEQYAGSVAGRPRPLPEELRAYLDEHADRRLWEAVRRLAV